MESSLDREREDEMRREALRHAVGIAGHGGPPTPGEVLDRARLFYHFLNGDERASASGRTLTAGKIISPSKRRRKK